MDEVNDGIKDDKLLLPKDKGKEEDRFLKKWAAPMLLGPFLPAIYSIIVIVGGSIVLNTFTGSCGAHLSDMLSVGIVLCYLFLILYTWVFLGDFIKISLPLVNMSVTILRPITSMRFLMNIYIALGFCSFIVSCVWAYFLSQATFCVASTPLLYSFSVFCVIMYWFGFGAILYYVMKLIFGSVIKAKIHEVAQAPTENDMEENIFRKLFKEIDRKKQGKIPKEELPRFFRGLGVYVPDEEIPEIVANLDPNNTGDIGMFPLLEWFKKYNNMAGKLNSGAGVSPTPDIAGPVSGGNNSRGSVIPPTNLAMDTGNLARKKSELLSDKDDDMDSQSSKSLRSSPPKIPPPGAAKKKDT